MKKAVLVSMFLFLLPFLLSADTSFLKLRASSHTGFVRIVLEGPEAIIGKGSVSRQGNDLLISFPDTAFSIQAEGAAIAYSKINKDTVRISAENFSGIKAFTLKDPSRLVIDAYTKDETAPPLSVLSQNEQRAKDLAGLKTVVIDPGHGGYESGITKDDIKEKNIVLDIARKLGELISSGPSRSYLTRGSDHFMALSERVGFTNSKVPDVFISLHIGNSREVVIYSPVVIAPPSDIVRPYLVKKGQSGYADQTQTLVRAMREALIASFGEDMVSVKPVPYTILSEIEAAALIIELPSFEYADYTEENNSEIADILYNGLYIYEKNKSK